MIGGGLVDGEVGVGGDAVDAEQGGGDLFLFGGGGDAELAVEGAQFAHLGLGQLLVGRFDDDVGGCAAGLQSGGWELGWRVASLLAVSGCGRRGWRRRCRRSSSPLLGGGSIGCHDSAAAAAAAGVAGGGGGADDEAERGRGDLDVEDGDGELAGRLTRPFHLTLLEAQHGGEQLAAGGGLDDDVDGAGELGGGVPAGRVQPPHAEAGQVAQDDVEPRVRGADAFVLGDADARDVVDAARSRRRSAGRSRRRSTVRTIGRTRWRRVGRRRASRRWWCTAPTARRSGRRPSGAGSPPNSSAAAAMTVSSCEVSRNVSSLAGRVLPSLVATWWPMRMRPASRRRRCRSRIGISRPACGRGGRGVRRAPAWR